jgi:Xaa-Pro aminopeptidase
MRHGLLKLGILAPEMGNAKKARKILREARKAGTDKNIVSLGTFFMHGTSHMMGLDVHDVGNRRDPKNRRKERKLEPGMVFTVEPGLYFNLNDERVAPQFRGIGIRIEDDVVVTADGCEVLTSAVPKSVVEIERLMATV